MQTTRSFGVGLAVSTHQRSQLLDEPVFAIHHKTLRQSTADLRDAGESPDRFANSNGVMINVQIQTVNGSRYFIRR
jgi:hypothetical protein